MAAITMYNNINVDDAFTPGFAAVATGVNRFDSSHYLDLDTRTPRVRHGTLLRMINRWSRLQAVHRPPLPLVLVPQRLPGLRTLPAQTGIGVMGQSTFCCCSKRFYGNISLVMV
jgi:hypothetical protein